MLKTNFKLPELRSEKHLAFVRSQDCLITSGNEHCNGFPVVAHHFTFLKGKRGISQKVGDDKTIPLCHFHHQSLHTIGEKSFWNVWHFGLFELEHLAAELCRKSPCNKARAIYAD